jgi:ankyrin repeat protein
MLDFFPAVSSGDLETVEYLLSKDLDVNVRDIDSKTALILS